MTFGNSPTMRAEDSMDPPSVAVRLTRNPFRSLSLSEFREPMTPILRFCTRQRLGRLPKPAAYLVIGLLASLSSVCIADQPPDLEGLARLLGQVERVELDYTESVELDLIEILLTTRGRLIFQAPDRIERISEGGEGFRLVGDALQLIRDAQVVRQLSVADIPPLAQTIGALRATFAGDVPYLRDLFKVTYRPAEDHWRLDLTPKAGPFSSALKRIRIRGNGDLIESIELHESDGDRRILELRLRERLPAGTS